MKRQGSEGSEKARKTENYSSFKEAVLNEWLPAAILIGVPANDFWYMNPVRLVPYIKADQIRQKRELEQVNFQCWMMGVYFTHSLGCAFSESNSYPDAPFDLFPEQISCEEQSRRSAQIFEAYVREYNLQLKKEER